MAWPRWKSHLRIEVLTPCPHRPPCPGCPRFGEQGLALAVRGQLEDLARLHGVSEVPVISGAAAGFRHRARLAIRGRGNSPKIGLFELDTHRVVHIPNCIIHHPLINRVATIVRRALVDSSVSPYSDAAHLGVARYLQVVIERQSQTAQVTLVANAADPGTLAACFNLIRDRLGPDLHSLWFNANRERANTVLGDEFHCWHGPPSVVEHFSGPAIHYPPGAFGQNNLEIAELIIEQVRAHIPKGARVAEFYAGVGAIGLSVLANLKELRMNEVSAPSLQGLDMGLAQLDSASRPKVTVVAGTAGAARHAASGVDIVIADPPRKGLDPDLTDHLLETPPERFIYVSCGLESFLRDIARLTSRSTMRLTSLTAFNLMPYTEHVETVACLERA
jgi:23S rRNA (uracil1939-C5)-methyltransferase